LHIGHAKAINFNFAYARDREGITFLRFVLLGNLCLFVSCLMHEPPFQLIATMTPTLRRRRRSSSLAFSASLCWKSFELGVDVTDLAPCLLSHQGVCCMVGIQALHHHIRLRFPSSHAFLSVSSFSFGSVQLSAVDHFGKIYDYGVLMIQRGHAYVCHQQSDEVSVLLGPGTALIFVTILSFVWSSQLTRTLPPSV
jgi:hypothetical protein